MHDIRQRGYLVIHLERFDRICRRIQDERPRPRTHALRMRRGERLIRVEPRRLYAIWRDVTHTPTARLALIQVPEKAAKAVVQDANGLRWTPHLDRLRRTVVARAEEGVEAADVVHVQVREEQVIDRTHLARLQR